MNKELLQERISKKEVEITKKENSIVRIQKEIAKLEEQGERFWVESRQDDLRRRNNELKELKEQLEKYLKQLEVEIQKEAKRNVPVITEFVNNWKERATEYYINLIPKYFEEIERLNKLEDEKLEGVVDCWQRHAIRKNIWAEFNMVYGTIHQAREKNGRSRLEETLKDMIAKEAVRKYDQLIETVEKITGEIEDCQGLRIDVYGNLNGLVIGKEGKAKVQTISAGGYNIQCYHYRTLVDRIK